MKYIVIDNFKLAVKELPFCYSTREFKVKKCVDTFNRVLFIKIIYIIQVCAYGVWYYITGC
jgi:hypothetical protein